ncbi:TetR/AcrR family transcriptional regulator [Sphingomonas sp. PAMC 26605]|uniref:TetR/AcrR family transcriptional regulator n=1 Tax=Sphingomonas sp. PAMC 26605 TaxID=1112214 RepID=UPI00026CDE16|nr:TetR/AcrR family transcriptional regulator [Sphingomonas sp. PAMC 26605]
MTTTRRPGRPKDLVKGDAILDAGWALFIEHGVEAVSIEAIAARAGVSRQMIYRNFADKHALFEQAAARKMLAIETVEIDRPGGREDTLEGALRTFGIAIMSYLASDTAVAFYNVLAEELRRRPNIAQRFYEIGPGQMIADLASILAGAGDRLVIDDHVKAAEALFGLWQGGSNFAVSLGVDAKVTKQAIVERVDYGVLLFMRAFSRLNL